MSTRGDIIRGAGGYLQRRGESDVLVGRPHSTLGTNGDVRVSMAEGVPRLYAKAGDTWYFTSLSDSDNPTLQLGTPGTSVDIEGDITMLGDTVFSSGAIKMGSASGGNIMLGHDVGSAGNGTYNISIGFETGDSIDEGYLTAVGNVMLANYAARYLTTGDYNICIGQAAGGTNNSTSIQGADNNVCIGRNSDTKANNDASGIAIGYGAKTGNEALALGKDADAADSCIDIRAAGSTRIYVDANGLVGIGTASPGQLVECVSNSNAYLILNANASGAGTDNAGIFLEEAGNNVWAIRFSGGDSNRLEILDTDFDDGVIMAQGGTGFSDVSDERVKTDLVTISDAVDKINTLRAVNFKWKYGREDRRTKNNVGLIAQDVYKVLPEAVTIPEGDYEVTDHPVIEGEKQAQNTWAIDKSKLVPLLVKAIQELSAKVTALENQ